MRRKREVQVSLNDLAEKLNGTWVQKGTAEVQLDGIDTLDDATETKLSFVISDKFRDSALKSKAGAFLVMPDVLLAGRPCLQVESVWKGVIQAIDVFYPDESAPADIHPTAVVDTTASIGKGVYVGPHAVVEKNARIDNGVEVGAQCYIGRDAVIGEKTVLYPRVTIQERVVVGRRVIIHSGAVLGADGFKYEVLDGIPRKVPQVGIVVIEDEVEIGANTCIDRAFLGETRIGFGTKIDNLVQVGHNCRIGKFNAMAAGVGFSGSVTTGTGCIFWGQAGLKEQVNIGDGAVVSAQSGIAGDLPPGSQVFGSPALPIREAARQNAALKRLPQLLRRVKKLEQRKGD